MVRPKQINPFKKMPGKTKWAGNQRRSSQSTGRKNNTRDNPEHYMCKQLVETVRLNEKRFPCLEWFHHVSNEGKRAPWMSKDLGIKKGVSDYHCPVPTYTHRGLYLEIKKPGDKPTLEQRRWLRDMAILGYETHWTDNLQTAFNIVLAYAKRATAWMRENAAELFEKCEAL